MVLASKPLSHPSWTFLLAARRSAQIHPSGFAGNIYIYIIQNVLLTSEFTSGFFHSTCLLAYAIQWTCVYIYIYTWRGIYIYF